MDEKQTLEALRRELTQAGYEYYVLDEPTMSDYDYDHKLRALEELGVRSPLRECGLTKERIRALSREAGLFTWNKPSYACLATRIPAGRAITRADLERAETGEALLSGLGFRDFRLRLSPDGCRLQVAQGQLPLVLERRADILAALGPVFSEIVLDLKPRIPAD